MGSKSKGSKRRRKPAKQATKPKRGRMKMSEVQVGMMVRVIGGTPFHSQIKVESIMVLREIKPDSLVLNVVKFAQYDANAAVTMATLNLTPSFHCNCPMAAREACEVETVHSLNELLNLFPDEKWPDGFNSAYIVRPDYKLELSSIVLSKEAKIALVAVLGTHKKEVADTVFNKWGFGRTIEKGRGMAMLFYGPPGTGKTKCAEAIANELGMKVKMIDPAILWSSEPGGAERTIKGIFDHAQKNAAGTLLLFDECEVLIADRSQTGQILAAQTNALLSALERFDGVSIFTTNRTPVLDPAFERRLQLKLEFPKPDRAMREAIWRLLVPKEAPLGADVCFKTLATSEISGGHIKNVLLNAARRAASQEYESIQMKHLLDALTDELNGMAAFAEESDTPKLGGMRMTQGVQRGMEIRREVKQVNDVLGGSENGSA